MKNFLENNRYSLVKYAVLTLGTIAVHNLSNAVAEQVWKRSLPLFAESKKSL